ncbi:unnamed protein product, partial [Allacma fusca]
MEVISAAVQFTLIEPFIWLIDSFYESLQLIRNMLMLRLLKGQLVVQNPPDVPSSLPPELQDFLKKCLTTNEHSRWTATQQLEH